MGVGERGTLKKLTGAARRWAGADKPPAPIQVDGNVKANLLRFGFSEESIEAVLAKEKEAAQLSGASDDFEVYEDNWESWLFYLTVQTQWLYAAGGMGPAQRVGLNYAGVESGARMSGQPRAKWPDLLGDLRVMELAVLHADAELAKEREQRSNK